MTYELEKITDKTLKLKPGMLLSLILVMLVSLAKQKEREKDDR